MKIFRVLLLAALGPFASAPAATFTVTHTGGSGAGSLQQAMLDANASPGLDTIAFNIPGTGLHTILAGDLPLITSPVLIDGYTQPGSSPNSLAVGDNAVLLIEIDGSGTTVRGDVPVFELNGPFGAGNSSGSTIRGLVISHLDRRVGIGVGSGVGNGSDNDTITGNFLGTDPTGMFNSAATYAIDSESSSALTVGGTTPAARNVISSMQIGVLLNLSNNCIVQGNYIGTNPAGNAPILAFYGVSIIQSSSGNLIGGTTPGAGNVINDQRAGILFGLGTTNNIAQGNLIGTDATGTLHINSGINGIIVEELASATIGGAAPGAGNVISGSAESGIVLAGGSPSSVIIQGNRIGTDVTGTAPIGNGQSGICMAATLSTGTIGGTGPGEANVIAFNATQGINVAGTGWTLRGNSMFSNGGLGISFNGRCDLRALPTPNDDGDGDSGPNNMQNFPLITTTGFTASSTTATGTFNSAASTTYELDFYADPPCSSRPQEFVQGKTYLGVIPVTTDGSGNATFNTAFPIGVDVGSRVTATATDPAGNTSELSERIVFSSSPQSGPAAGGTNFDLTGMLFASPATVTVGAVPATNVVVVNSADISATTPALTPGTVNDIIVTVPGITGKLPFAFVADFLDVPQALPPYPFVTKLVANVITAGCGGGNFCPGSLVTRAQMAVFLLRGKNGLCFTPSPATGTVFGDVPANSFAAAYIEALFAAQVTSGCGGGNYCPETPVTRDQMAVFLLRTLEGPAYVPLACVSPLFGDVPCASPFSRWIDELANRGITAGCGGGNYCPSGSVSRGQMAVFLSTTFSLP